VSLDCCRMRARQVYVAASPITTATERHQIKRNPRRRCHLRCHRRHYPRRKSKWHNISFKLFCTVTVCLCV